MAKVGVLIETEDGKVKQTNFGALSAARAGGANDVFALLVDGEAETLKEELSGYGARHIVALKGDGVDLAASPDIQARVLAGAAKNYELEALVGLASARGRDIFARLAAFLNTPMISDCVAVDIAEKTVKKSHFSGKTLASIKLASNLMLCTIRPNAIEPIKDAVDADVLEFTAPAEGPDRVKVVEIKKEASGKIDLTEAATIITGGRPIGSAENYQMLEECAALLNAAVGASRAAVDSGYAPHSMQVGQTGKTVSPNLYIACGLSGSVQHFAGMKTSKVIVAINTDKDAPIFEKCDYGIIGDIFEVVPVLTEVLREQAG